MPLKEPENGTMAVVETGAPANQMDSIVEFRCNDGYELVDGDVSLVCLASGEWSGEAPLCVPDDCEDEITPTTSPTTVPELTTAAVTTVGTSKIKLLGMYI